MAGEMRFPMSTSSLTSANEECISSGKEACRRPQSHGGCGLPYTLAQNRNALSVAHTHIRTYARTHIRTYAHTHIHTYARTHVRTYARTHIRTYAHMYVSTLGLLIEATLHRHLRHVSPWGALPPPRTPPPPTPAAGVWCANSWHGLHGCSGPLGGPAPAIRRVRHAAEAPCGSGAQPSPCGPTPHRVPPPFPARAVPTKTPPFCAVSVRAKTQQTCISSFPCLSKKSADEGMAES